MTGKTKETKTKDMSSIIACYPEIFEAFNNHLVNYEIAGAFRRAAMTQGLRPYDPEQDGYNQLTKAMEAVIGSTPGSLERRGKNSVVVRVAEMIFGEKTALGLIANNEQTIEALNRIRTKSSNIMLPRVESPEISEIRLEMLLPETIFAFMEGWENYSPKNSRSNKGPIKLKSGPYAFTVDKKDKKVRLVDERVDRQLKISDVDRVVINWEQLAITFASGEKALTFTNRGEDFFYEPAADLIDSSSFQF